MHRTGRQHSDYIVRTTAQCTDFLQQCILMELCDIHAIIHTYQLYAPANQEGPLHSGLGKLGGWEKLPQGANHRQATIPFSSWSIVHQDLSKQKMQGKIKITRGCSLALARQKRAVIVTQLTSFNLFRASDSAGSARSLCVSSVTSSSNWSSNSWGSDSSAFLVCVPLQVLSPWKEAVYNRRDVCCFNLSGETASHILVVLKTMLSSRLIADKVSLSSWPTVNKLSCGLSDYKLVKTSHRITNLLFRVRRSDRLV